MKYKIFAFALAAVLIVSFSSCNSCSKKKETREEQIQEFRSTLTKEDTTTMLKLCDDAMEQLKNGQYEKVLSGLYEYTDSPQSVKPITPETKKHYLKMFKMFPVRDYHRIYYSFQLEGCNDVKYKVTWATAEQAGTKDPATTAYMFNPVKIDDKWHLCVKTLTDQIDETMR